MHPSVVFALWCATCETPTEVQRKSRALGRQVQGRQRSQSSIHGARRISFSHGVSKISGYNVHTFQYGRRSQRHGIGTHACAYVGSSQIAEIAGERMPTSMDTIFTQSETEKLGRNRRTRCSSWSIFLRLLFGRNVLVNRIGRITFATKLVKVPPWECLHIRRESQLFLSVLVDDIKMVGKREHVEPM